MAGQICILATLILSFSIAKGQAYIKIHGIVIDSTGTPLESATVMLISPDTTYTLSSKIGHFEFRLDDRNHSIKPITLIVSIKGYKTQTKTYIYIPFQTELDLGSIPMRIAYSDLERVEVTALSPVVQKEDTTEYRVRYYTNETGDDLEDLLKNLPGIEVGIDGKVSVLGKSVATILVNGKEFFGNDIQIALQNLPADIIEKVQVIDDYGDEARLTGIKTAEPNKVLNIELKKDKRNGEFGNIAAGVGDKGRYMASAMASSFAGDRQCSILGGQNNASGNGASFPTSKNQAFATTYSNKLTHEITGQGTIEYNNTTKMSETDGNQLSFYDGETESIEHSSTTQSGSRAIQAHFNLQFQRPEFVIFRINPNIQIQQSGASSNGASLVNQVDTSFNRTTESQSVFEAKSRNLNRGSTLYFEKMFKNHKRRFSIMSSISQNPAETNSQNETQTILTSGTASDSAFENYYIRNTSKIFNFSTSANYYEPLPGKAFLNIQYSIHQAIARQDLTTSTPDSANKSLMIIDSLSNISSTSTIVQQLHIGYIAEISGFNLNLGADALPNFVKINYFGKSESFSYHQIDYSPAVALMYTMSKQRHLSLSYSGHTKQPNPYQLQRVPYVVNPQYPTEGNPQLKPEFTHSFAVQYEQSSLTPTKYSGFSLGLHYSETTDKIIINLLHPENDGPVIQETTFLNSGGFYSAGGNIHVNFPSALSNMVKISETTTFNAGHTISMLDSSRFPITQQTFTQAVNVNVNVKKRVEFDVSATYSLSYLHYSGEILPSERSCNIAIGSNSKIALPKNLTLTLAYSESFISGPTQRLTSNPAVVNALLQKTFLAKRPISFKVSVYNLFNSNVGNIRYASLTAEGQNRSNVIGQIFLISVIYKFSRFHK